MNTLDSRLIRLALLASLALLWLNYLLTARWAAVEGSLHGPKEPWFVAALLVATAFMFRRGQAPMRWPGSLGHFAAIAGITALGAAFLVWMPLSSWHQVPFLDNWPSRYQATLDLVSAIDAGTLAGWQWSFLGGYHTSSDVTVSLGLLAWIPIKLLGPAVGFHLLHLLLFLAVPALVWLDLKVADDDSSGLAPAAAGWAAWIACGYSYFLLRSGDTNSLAGVVTMYAAVVGAHASRRRRPWGAFLLVTSLVLTNYSHAGFFLYGLVFLALDAALNRDGHGAARLVIAALVSLVAALPLTWEAWRYPAYFTVNNVVYSTPPAIDWISVARKVFYNVELLWLPGRWFNDYTGLAYVLLPLAAVVAWRDKTRLRFYGIGVLAVFALTRLDDPHFGYAFIRPIHLFPLFVAPLVALWTSRLSPGRVASAALVVVFALQVQVWWKTVPHVTSVEAAHPALVERVRNAPGALVLVENNPHRNMSMDPGPRLERSKFGIHFEPLLAARTERRLYAGYWDGWQWNPWKGQTVAGGTFMGRGLPSTPHDEFVAEMQRWGVVSLLVWSGTTRRYLEQDARFEPVWQDADWTEFRLHDADTREVTVPRGTAKLSGRALTGATISLDGVTQGDPVVVRTNYFPAWTATAQVAADARPVTLRSAAGQLAFDAPCSGACEVRLDYPRRQGLIWLALLAVIAGVWAAGRNRAA